MQHTMLKLVKAELGERDRLANTIVAIIKLGVKENKFKKRWSKYIIFDKIFIFL